MAKTGKSKQKKMNARVDFTPMVDMIMLLVTFFMLCTTLLKPQTMEISMPSDKDDLKDEQKNQAKASEAITRFKTNFQNQIWKSKMRSVTLRVKTQ